MASAEVSGFRRRNGALWLAVVVLVGLLAGLLLLMSVPAARADSPQITLSTSTTNPGGEIFVTGTGWAPAKHYNLYVYSQKACNGATTCPVPNPASKYLINSAPAPIHSDGTLQKFDFTFLGRAATITYVFTVIADYPTDTPYMASAPEQVVPAGTPPSGTPISSNPSPTATVASTNTPVVTATTGSQGNGNGNGNQDNTQQSGSSDKVLIGVVGVLLFIMIVILIALLIVLPPKRRAIRAAYYGSQARGNANYAAPGVQSRRTTGGYPPLGEPEQPWQGGVAQWDDQPRPPRGSGPAARDRFTPRQPPRRPTDREY